MVKFFRKYHKWVGLVLTIFILMFAVSGVLLNHRRLIASFDLPRAWLPAHYHYSNWNNGAASGTLRLGDAALLLYGNAGLWLTDTLAARFTPFMEGLPKGTDNRAVRAVVALPSGELFAISPYHLYRLSGEQPRWQVAQTSIPADEACVDLLAQADTLYVVTRSAIYRAAAPYAAFLRLPLPAPEDYSPKVSLFRTLWLLHSGELFGLPGRLVVDILGLTFAFLCVTGVILTFVIIPIRRRKRKGLESSGLKGTWNFSLKWHNRLGSVLFVLLLLMVLTGMFLRPPLLIAIARAKVAAIPGTTLSTQDPWYDKLRRLRHDDRMGAWLLSSSEGIYTFTHFGDLPQRKNDTPPVSVMGMNVWTQLPEGQWLIGSFSGIYTWDLASGAVADYLTGQPYTPGKGGRFMFGVMVSGFSADFACGPVVFDYSQGALPVRQGAGFPPMPSAIGKGRISLWNFALELHVGRLYQPFLRGLTVWYIPVGGLLILLVVVSGYIVYRRRFKRKKRKKR